MKSARLILFYLCNRNCVGCCNNYLGNDILPKPIRLENLNQLGGFDHFVITGGEPLLRPQDTLTIIKLLKQWYPETKIFLYTTLWNADFFYQAIEYLEGVHYTLHKDFRSEDMANFVSFQHFASYHPGHSFRLYIEPGYPKKFQLNPTVWDRVQLKPWIDEGGSPLGEGETLFEIGQTCSLEDSRA